MRVFKTRSTQYNVDLLLQLISVWWDCYRMVAIL